MACGVCGGVVGGVCAGEGTVGGCCIDVDGGVARRVVNAGIGTGVDGGVGAIVGAGGCGFPHQPQC